MLDCLDDPLDDVAVGLFHAPNRRRRSVPPGAVGRHLRALDASGSPPSRPNASQVVQSVGEGYEPPHRASVAALSAEVRYAAGVDKGMVVIG